MARRFIDLPGAIAAVLVLVVAMLGALFVIPLEAPAHAIAAQPSECTNTMDLEAQATKHRVIGALGVELEEIEVMYEHAEYHERNMQWAYLAGTGDLQLRVMWDAVGQSREQLRLHVTDVHGTEVLLEGPSPITGSVPVPDGLGPDESWVMDLRIDPLDGLDTTAAEQPVRVDLWATSQQLVSC